MPLWGHLVIFNLDYFTGIFIIKVVLKLELFSTLLFATDVLIEKISVE